MRTQFIKSGKPYELTRAKKAICSQITMPMLAGLRTYAAPKASELDGSHSRQLAPKRANAAGTLVWLVAGKSTPLHPNRRETIAWDKCWGP